MSNYVLPVSSLPRYQLGRPQQSGIQQILGLGYLQESNRTQWYNLEWKDKRCILLGLDGIQYDAYQRKTALSRKIAPG